MKKIAAACAMAVALAGALATALTPAWGAGTDVYFNVDKVLVNRTGGITAMGTVDCAAQVAVLWPDRVPDGTSVLVNVDWTAYQRQGRQMITASLGDDAQPGDSQASPCWSNTSEFLDPGRCVFNPSDGSYHPCRWDSNNWGASGWEYGNGAFKAGLVHLDTTLRNGFWGDPDPETGEYATFDFFQIAGWDVRATKG